MKKRIFLLCTFLSWLLIGCGSGNDPDASTSIHASDGNRAYDFIFICPIIDTEYWQDCIKGIKKADEELGTNTRVIGSQHAENIATEVVSHMEEAIASEPDGIMGYAGIEGLFPLIDQAADKGIPFLAVDSDAPDTSRVAYIGTNLYSLGYQAGETMVKLTGGSAKIGYLCSTFSAQSEALVFGAFQDAVSDYDMEVVAREEGGTTTDSAEQAARDMLAEHPELTAVFCTSSYNATSTAKVKKELGMDDMVLIGLDDTKENLSYVREGVINAILVQSPYQMGYQGVHLLKDYVDKGRLLKDNYDTGSLLVTLENVDSYKE